jgi:hypothetical protein
MAKVLGRPLFAFYQGLRLLPEEVEYSASPIVFCHDGFLPAVGAIDRKRKKSDADDALPCFLEPELPGGRSRRTWAWLIRRIREVDPLVYPKCNGQMRMIASIEKMDVM